jgi:hypothetical protein
VETTKKTLIGLLNRRLTESCRLWMAIVCNLLLLVGFHYNRMEKSVGNKAKLYLNNRIGVSVLHKTWA